LPKREENSIRKVLFVKIFPTKYKNSKVALKKKVYVILQTLTIIKNSSCNTHGIPNYGKPTVYLTVVNPLRIR